MEPTRHVAANKVGTCSDEHGSFEKWIMRSLGMTLCQTRAGAGDIPLVTSATVSPINKQGQVRDAMITYLSLFSFGHHSRKGCAGYTCPLQAMGCVSRALPDLSCHRNALRHT